jgi:hypothetical protein
VELAEGDVSVSTTGAGTVYGALGCLGGAVEVRPSVARVVDHDLHDEVAAQVLGQGVEIRQKVGRSWDTGCVVGDDI